MFEFSLFTSVQQGRAEFCRVQLSGVELCSVKFLIFLLQLNTTDNENLHIRK